MPSGLRSQAPVSVSQSLFDSTFGRNLSSIALMLGFGVQLAMVRPALRERKARRQATAVTAADRGADLVRSRERKVLQNALNG